jgi:hypothetical protein
VRLALHQAHVLLAIGEYEKVWGYADSRLIGCRRTCEHLVAMGLITEVVVHGPLGGHEWRYRLTTMGRRRSDPAAARL